jgi:hypothetical protein
MTSLCQTDSSWSFRVSQFRSARCETKLCPASMRRALRSLIPALAAAAARLTGQHSCCQTAKVILVNQTVTTSVVPRLLKSTCILALFAPMESAMETGRHFTSNDFKARR